MGVKLMTGATGEQNIQAADDRECLAGITGLDSYVFPTGSQLKATLVDANTVTIGTGAGSLQGSRFRCSTTTTVNIQSGTQGQFRRDVIGLRFSRETSGRESMEFQVLTGDPAASEGAATDPAFAAGDLLKGDAEAFMPLYRVKLSGINAADPEPMFSVLTPLATLGDSVSHDGASPFAGGYLYRFGPLYMLQIQNMTIQAGVVRNVGKLPVKPSREVVGAISYGSSAGYVSVHADGTVYCTSKSAGDFSGQVCFVA